MKSLIKNLKIFHLFVKHFKTIENLKKTLEELGSNSSYYGNIHFTEYFNKFSTKGPISLFVFNYSAFSALYFLIYFI